jgi:hypothetical protein
MKIKDYVLNVICVLPYNGHWRDTVRCAYVSRWVALGWIIIGNPGNRIEAQ